MEMTDRSQELIGLLFHEKDLRDAVYPFLNGEIFQDPKHAEIIRTFLKLKEENSKYPSPSDLRYVLPTDDLRNELDNCLKQHSDVNPDIRREYIKEWFKTRMMVNTLERMTDGLDEKGADSIVPFLDKLREICAFSFDVSVGMDFTDKERLYAYTHGGSKTYTTGLRELDMELGGGWRTKTVSLLLAATNVGKTLCKCAFAVNAFLAGHNVLYITLEMSEEEICNRLYANAANTPISSLPFLSKEEFFKGYQTLIGKTNRLFVREFPTGAASANTIRNLLKELKIKQNFVPELVFVDYLSLMDTNHAMRTENSDTKITTLVTELRGLAVENDFAVVTSNQSNRSGFGKAEVTLTNAANSIGQTTVADAIISIGQDAEMLNDNKYNFTMSKNRFNKKGKKMVVNVNYDLMRIYQETDDDRVDQSLANMNQLMKSTKRDNVEKLKASLLGL